MLLLYLFAFCVKVRESLPSVRSLQMLQNEPKHCNFYVIMSVSLYCQFVNLCDVFPRCFVLSVCQPFVMCMEQQNTEIILFILFSFFFLCHPGLHTDLSYLRNIKSNCNGLITVPIHPSLGLNLTHFSFSIKMDIKDLVISLASTHVLVYCDEFAVKQ